MSTDHIRVISPDEVDQLLPLERAIAAVEASFRAHAKGEATLFPVVRERLDDGSVCGVKSGYWPARHVVGLKLAGYWPGNLARQIPNHQASVLLADAATGRLLALMDGNVITSRRTAAAGVVAARILARPAPRVLAVLGSGAQGHNQARSLLASFPSITDVRLWDRQAGRAEALARALRSIRPFTVSTAAGPAEAIRGADLIATTTASPSALFELEDVPAGAHVNAMGSDTAGKRELAVPLVESSLLVVDDRAQSLQLGESQPPVRWKEEPATIGEILVGTRQGRTEEGQITVFDSTGIGLQDLAAAESVYRESIRQGMGTVIPWTPSV